MLRAENCVVFLPAVVQVPDGATVALIPRSTKNHLHDSHDYMPGESESVFTHKQLYNQIHTQDAAKKNKK